MAIADIRRDYTIGHLDRADLDANPLKQFERWFSEAVQAKTTGSRLRRFAIGIYKSFGTLFGAADLEANAMALATVSPDGKPSARTVLLKGVDQRGFVFFTNYESRKGRELEVNPRATAVFPWIALERQVIIEGSVTRVAREESEAYFHSRPRASQLAAWGPQQSSVLPGRAQLEDSYKAVERQHEGREVPLPPHWGGWRISPETVEFWQGRPSRLHDRLRYSRQPDGSWRRERLAP